ncbi:MAG: hypothetical protein H6510_10445 [Acidobacteria bacterium]|nr:hypothetical protein [Acidobacteriota bacterium]
MKKIIILLCLACTVVYAQKEDDGGSRGPKGEPSTSNLAINGPVTPRGGGDSYATGFEGSEGFTPGFLGTQGGWSTFLVSTAQPVITNANANGGTQALRIDVDGSIGAGNLTGGFSPLTTPTDPMAPTRCSVNVFISGTGGADYDVAPQAPSQGFLTARVNFRFTGPIRVLDGGSFVDTGVTWPVNQWFNLTIDCDPAAPRLDYYIDGSLIYTANALVGGTTMEQVVLISDNFHFGDVGDFDDLEFGPPVLVTIPTLSQWGLIGFLALMLCVSFVFIRKQQKVEAV